MRREIFQLQDRAWYVGPQPGCRHYGDNAYVDQAVGSTGKVRGLERGAVYVSWGEGEEGWEPRAYLMTFREWQRKTSLACGRWQHEVEDRICDCGQARSFHADFYAKANRGLPVGQ